MEILGIDIGGSGMKGAIVNVETGEMLTERFRIPTPQARKPAPMRDTVIEILNHFQWKGRVGVSFPTVVEDGVCRSSGNISPDWLGIPIGQYFGELAPEVTFTVGNDADLAGLAEMQFGAGKGQMGKVIMLTIGTGIGSGFFMDGTLVPNFELGFLLHPNGKRIELFAADSARKRDELTLEEWAGRFDMFLNYTARVLTPSLFILGGGLSKKFDQFSAHLTVQVPVVPAHFRNRAGIIGAAMYGC